MGQPFFMRIQKIFKQLLFFIAKFGILFKKVCLKRNKKGLLRLVLQTKNQNV
jgi:hypothetical protein